MYVYIWIQLGQKKTLTKNLILEKTILFKFVIQCNITTKKLLKPLSHCVTQHKHELGQVCNVLYNTGLLLSFVLWKINLWKFFFSNIGQWKNKTIILFWLLSNIRFGTHKLKTNRCSSWYSFLKFITFPASCPLSCMLSINLWTIIFMSYHC